MITYQHPDELTSFVREVRRQREIALADWERAHCEGDDYGESIAWGRLRTLDDLEACSA